MKNDHKILIIGWIGSALLLSVIVLYVLLLLGLPMGEFVMGGNYKVLPGYMRIACGMTIVVQIFAVLIILQLSNVLSISLPMKMARSIGFFFGFYFFINSIIAYFSNSDQERIFMTPLAAIVASCFVSVSYRQKVLETNH